jgi:transcriptional regulator with XRE-family HTH domain
MSLNSVNHGKRLEYLLFTIGISKKEIADKLSINQSNISKWIKESKFPDDRQVLLALGISTKNRRLYSWKDTAVCDLLDNGTDIANIQQQAGHEHSSQTIHYARLKASGPREKLNSAFDRL